MSGFQGLPDTRRSLRGTDPDGDEVWLIRSISQKLYHCPGCHGSIEIGADHVVVQYVHRGGGTTHHHWHRRCTSEILISQLRGLGPVAASESRRDRLEARGRQKPKHRRNPRRGR